MSGKQHFYLVGASRDYMEKQTPTFGHGRVCQKHGCATVLSAYNPDEFCAVHRPEDDPEHMRYSGYEFAECPVCGEVRVKKDYRHDKHMCRSCWREQVAAIEGAQFRCSRCHEVKAPSEMSSNKCWCRACQRDYHTDRRRKRGVGPRAEAKPVTIADERQAARERYARRRSTPEGREHERQKARDRYHRRKHGMTEAEYKAQKKNLRGVSK